MRSMPKHCSDTALHKEYGMLGVKQHIGRQRRPKTDMPRIVNGHTVDLCKISKIFLSFFEKRG